MSNTILGIFLSAVMLLFVALLVDNTLIAGGSGLVLLVGSSIPMWSPAATRNATARPAPPSKGQMPPGV